MRISLDPLGQRIVVPEEYWQDLSQTDIKEVCSRSGATFQSNGAYVLGFFNSSLLIDTSTKQGYLDVGGTWAVLDQPLVVLLGLVYLLNASQVDLSNDIIGVEQLKDSHFFQGPHKLKTEFVLKRYGSDPKGLDEAALKLGCEKLDLADMAYKFMVFPKIPVYCLFWRGDDEFPPNLKVLFDRTIESHLAADSIWGIVNLICDLLTIGQGLDPLIAKSPKNSSSKGSSKIT